MVAGLFIMFITLYITQPSSHKGLNPVGLEPKEALLLVCLYAAMLGLLLAWKWEGFGGLLTLLALTGFSYVYYTLKTAILWNIWIMGIPAFLFIICWWFTDLADGYDVYRS